MARYEGSGNSLWVLVPLLLATACVIPAKKVPGIKTHNYGSRPEAQVDDYNLEAPHDVDEPAEGEQGYEPGDEAEESEPSPSKRSEKDGEGTYDREEAELFETGRGTSVRGGGEQGSLTDYRDESQVQEKEIDVSANEGDASDETNKMSSLLQTEDDTINESVQGDGVYENNDDSLNGSYDENALSKDGDVLDESEKETKLDTDDGVSCKEESRDVSMSNNVDNLHGVQRGNRLGNRDDTSSRRKKDSKLGRSRVDVSNEVEKDDEMSFGREKEDTSQNGGDYGMTDADSDLSENEDDTNARVKENELSDTDEDTVNAMDNEDNPSIMEDSVSNDVTKVNKENLLNEDKDNSICSNREQHSSQLKDGKHFHKRKKKSGHGSQKGKPGIESMRDRQADAGALSQRNRRDGGYSPIRLMPLRFPKRRHSHPAAHTGDDLLSGGDDRLSGGDDRLSGGKAGADKPAKKKHLTRYNNKLVGSNKAGKILDKVSAQSAVKKQITKYSDKAGAGDKSGVKKQVPVHKGKMGASDKSGVKKQVPGHNDKVGASDKSGVKKQVPGHNDKVGASDKSGVKKQVPGHNDKAGASDKLGLKKQVLGHKDETGVNDKSSVTKQVSGNRPNDKTGASEKSGAKKQVSGHKDKTGATGSGKLVARIQDEKHSGAGGNLAAKKQAARTNDKFAAGDKSAAKKQALELNDKADLASAKSAAGKQDRRSKVRSQSKWMNKRQHNVVPRRVGTCSKVHRRYDKADDCERKKEKDCDKDKDEEKENDHCRSDYGYGADDGPDHWVDKYPDCGGDRQSPINIDTSITLIEYEPLLKWKGYDILPCRITITNNGKTVVLVPSYDTSQVPYIYDTISKQEFVLGQLHFHWGSDNKHGSEHTINYKQYAMEMHSVHYRRELGGIDKASQVPGGLTIVTTFFQVGKSNPGMRNMQWSFAKIRSAPKCGLVAPFPLCHLIRPFAKHYLTYNGSLTTPPCSETVKYILDLKVSHVSKSQLNRFRRFKNARGERILHNLRPIQPINCRQVVQAA